MVKVKLEKKTDFKPSSCNNCWSPALEEEENFEAFEANVQT
jgi:hypothetical protein